MGIKEKIKELAPSVDELADVMDPLNSGEALAPISNDDSPLKFPSASATSTVKEKLKELTPAVDELAEVMEPIHEKEALAPMKEPVPERLLPETLITIDPLNRIFGDVMRTVCNVGLAVIIIASALYFLGIYPGDNPNLEVLKWNEPASAFWKDVKGIDLNGYSWFLSDVMDPEDIVILGTTFLALTPLIGFMFAIPKSHGAMRVLLFIITIEFVYAILRPLLMNVGGVA
ncbi:MAG: hypothetical protein H0Z28_04065 [Archaeoglobus sp.]|nr:hypothetical protein [Archaeoglobus sp.]